MYFRSRTVKSHRSKHYEYALLNACNIGIEENSFALGNVQNCEASYLTERAKSPIRREFFLSSDVCLLEVTVYERF